jgi:P pilus assembly chaperone PapD
MKIFKTAILSVLLSMTNLILHAQLAISPPYVSVDGKSGVGNIYITNNSEKPQEVEISFEFGYPASDEEGNIVMNYKDTVAYKQYAMDPFVRAFPRTFILQGNQQRTIRVQVKPSPGMKDGFYFTRAKVLAKPQTAEVVNKPVGDAVTTRLVFNFEQVIPAFYRRGKVTTGLKIEKIDATQKDTMLLIKSQIDRLGEAPFIGSMTAKLIDIKGKVVATTQFSTTAYFKVLRRIDLDIAKVTPGSYKLELIFETKRGDMAITDLVQAPPVSESIDILIK